MQLLLLPRLMRAIGEARSCAAGLVVLAAALASSARVRTLPLHALLFLAARAGLAVAETANVALTARHSRPAERGPNLAYLQSFQAGCRIITPWIANYLFTLSLGGKYGTPGALPFLGTALLALLTAPVPLLLQRRPMGHAGSQRQRQRVGAP
mmetsp:Transcript_37763/g.126357  ORF Transcript_37763/g.126357 Transcript_37763/m.126357 type:complete len:153 (+) Transcript_37763:355-813(+)